MQSQGHGSSGAASASLASLAFVYFEHHLFKPIGYYEAQGNDGGFAGAALYKTRGPRIRCVIFSSHTYDGKQTLYFRSLQRAQDVLSQLGFHAVKNLRRSKDHPSEDWLPYPAAFYLYRDDSEAPPSAGVEAWELPNELVKYAEPGTEVPSDATVLTHGCGASGVGYESSLEGLAERMKQFAGWKKATAAEFKAVYPHMNNTRGC